MTESLVVLFVTGIAIYAGLRNFLFAFRVPGKPEYYFFALSCFAAATYNGFASQLYRSDSFATSIWYQRGQFSSAAILCIAFLFFLQSILKISIRKPFWIFFAFWSLFAILVWLPIPGTLSLEHTSLKEYYIGSWHIRYMELQPGFLCNLFFFSILVGLLLLLRYVKLIAISQYRNLQKRLIIAVAIFAFAAIHDILLGLQWIHSIYIMEYAFLGIIFLMDDHMHREFLDLLTYREQQNQILERKVRERMNDIQNLAMELQSKNMALEHSNKNLKAISEKDGLTGLYNHKSFLERLQEATNLSRREGFSIGIGMIDIDHFKNFNDRYGHQLGDEVLCIVASILRSGFSNISSTHFELNKVPPKSELRNYDIVSRYGGDEFAVILYFCDLVTAHSVLERIHNAVSSVRLSQDPELRITLSIGLAIANHLPIGVSANAILKYADLALYEAKNTGRDRSVVKMIEDL